MLVVLVRFSKGLERGVYPQRAQESSVVKSGERFEGENRRLTRRRGKGRREEKAKPCVVLFSRARAYYNKPSDESV